MAEQRRHTELATVADTYFRAWLEKDWTTLRSILADDASFDRPLASLADLSGMGLSGLTKNDGAQAELRDKGPAVIRPAH